MSWLKLMLLAAGLILSSVGCGGSGEESETKKPVKEDEFPDEESSEDAPEKRTPRKAVDEPAPRGDAEEPDPGEAEGTDEPAPRVENPLRRKRGGDVPAPGASFTTPKACIEAFVKACREKDRDAYLACLSRDCDRELREAYEDEESFDEICATMAAATFATDQIVVADDEAMCDVTIDDRPETLHLRREGGEWKVVGA